MADNSINLMPEDLRKKEEEANARKQQTSSEPDLFVPGKFELPKEDQKNLSGSKPSFFANLGKLFTKKPKAVVTEEAIKAPESSMPTTVREPLRIVDQPFEAGDLRPPVAPSLAVPPPVTPPSPVREISKDSKFHQPEKVIRARFVDDGGGVNLVPSSSQIKSWKQISTLLAATLVSAVVIVAIFYFGLLTMNKTLDTNRTETLTKISEIEKELLSFGEKNKEINKKGKEISLVYDVLNKHIYWTNFFQLLEKYTTEDVYYTGFSAGNNGAIMLDAVGTNYAAVGRQLKILQQEQAKEFATEVDISSASLHGLDGVSFTITLVLNPELFYYKKL